MTQRLILAVNPGGTSTKAGLYREDEMLFDENIHHEAEDLAAFGSTYRQMNFRKDLVLEVLKDKGYSVEDLTAVVGRGGTFKPLKSGTYRVNQKLLDDIRDGSTLQADHPSNLGAPIAWAIAGDSGIPAYFVDPVCVDEMIDEARYSGHPLLPRKSLSHALNIRMVAYKASARMNKPLNDLNLVVMHLGSGISVNALEKGRMIDTNNANDGGPFSSTRTGGLPVTGLMKLCFSGKYSAAELKRMLLKQGGVYAYLGDEHVGRIWEKVEAGDKKADSVLRGMIYQMAKEAGAMGAALKGRVDAVVITGGMAYNSWVTEQLEQYLSYLGKIMVFPGEAELEALTRGVLRVLDGVEEVKEYK
ncbi:butyrate kinase [Candidatus Fermentibacteria bacterium]|nr:MAG: butyrate kinase [Candidatus Fermentibacteria bacterium]PIE52311.1 MAG: butyrate kinase [Candidatus Fermentibacteria bacterium]